jgi:hypothetical protein
LSGKSSEEAENLQRKRDLEEVDKMAGNNKTDLQRTGGEDGTGLTWLRYGQMVVFCGAVLHLRLPLKCGLS